MYILENVYCILYIVQYTVIYIIRIVYILQNKAVNTKFKNSLAVCGYQYLLY